MYMKKRISFFWFGLVISFICCTGAGASCSGPERIVTVIKDHYVYDSFKDVGPNISVYEFNKKFTIGDIISVKIDTHDGKSYSLIMPYVSTYAEAGDYAPCMCDDVDQHTGIPTIDLSLNMWPYGQGVKTSDFFNCPVTFTMYSKGGYSKTLKFINCSEKLTLDQLYGDDKAYTNFRGIIETGSINKYIKPTTLYRSSTPLIESASIGLGNRYLYVNALAQNNKIEEILCLSHEKDGPGGYGEHIAKLKERYESPYICKLYDEDHCHCFNLGNDYFSDGEQGGASKMRSILRVIISYVSGETPKRVLIHCDEGKDRTGFICALLEAFASPIKNDIGEYEYISEQDIVSDFMTSYRNYYNITSTDSVQRYQAFLENTIYRHLLAICCENPSVELGKINWYDPNFSAREAFKEKLKTHNLWWYTYRFLRGVIKLNADEIKELSKLYINNMPEPPYIVEADC